MSRRNRGTPLLTWCLVLRELPIVFHSPNYSFSGLCLFYSPKGVHRHLFETPFFQDGLVFPLFCDNIKLVICNYIEVSVVSDISGSIKSNVFLSVLVGFLFNTFCSFPLVTGVKGTFKPLYRKEP